MGINVSPKTKQRQPTMQPDEHHCHHRAYTGVQTFSQFVAKHVRNKLVHLSKIRKH